MRKLSKQQIIDIINEMLAEAGRDAIRISLWCDGILMMCAHIGTDTYSETWHVTPEHIGRRYSGIIDEIREEEPV